MFYSKQTFASMLQTHFYKCAVCTCWLVHTLNFMLQTRTTTTATA